MIDFFNKNNRSKLDQIWNIKNFKNLEESVFEPAEYFTKLKVFEMYMKLPEKAVIIENFDFDK